MPNWCSNNLTISGTPDRLRQFLTENVKEREKFLTENVKEREKILDFNFVSPQPKGEDWYHWRVENWGTKWTGDVYFVEHAQPDALTINFDTAWSPPEAWIEKASRQYPDLHFYLKYEEPMMNFAGYFQAKNGETAGECTEIEDAQ